MPHKLLINIGVREQVKKVLGFWKDSCFFPLIMQIKITDFTHGLIQLPSLDKEGEIYLPFSEEKLVSLKLLY